MEWPVPKDVHYIKSFMGLTGYYRIFLEKNSRKAHPVTSLQKKSVQFVWRKQFQDRFDKLKHLLSTTPILTIADPNKYFVVCTDANKYSLGGVLTQKGHVICYDTRNLKDHEKNYVVRHGIDSYHPFP